MMLLNGVTPWAAAPAPLGPDGADDALTSDYGATGRGTSEHAYARTCLHRSGRACFLLAG